MALISNPSGSGLEKSTALKEDEKRKQCREKVTSRSVKLQRTRFTDSTLVTKFVNSMMWGGKKSTAQGIFYTAMTNLESEGWRRGFEAVQEGNRKLQAAA